MVLKCNVLSCSGTCGTYCTIILAVDPEEKSLRRLNECSNAQDIKLNPYIKRMGVREGCCCCRLSSLFVYDDETKVAT